MEAVAGKQAEQATTVDFNIDANYINEATTVSAKAEVYLTDDTGELSIIELYYETDRIKILLSTQ
jgi:hypothetical protein